MPRSIIRKRLLFDRHRPWIDGSKLVGAEFVEPRSAARIDDDAVRTRILRRRGHQTHGAGPGVQMSHEVRELRGEPDVATAVECHGVGIPSLWIRHFVDRALARCRIEPTDPPVPVAGEPDTTGPVDDEIVWIGAGFDLISPELSGGGIEIGDVVPLLPEKPDAPLGVAVQVARQWVR